LASLKHSQLTGLTLKSKSMPPKGYKCSSDTIRKISDALKLQWSNGTRNGPGAETRLKIGMAQIGRVHTQEAIEKNRIAHLGSNSPCWKGGLTKLICPVCGDSFWIAPHQLQYREFAHCSRSCQAQDIFHPTGPEAPNWKGGVTSEDEKARRSQEYFDWRRRVFERDDWTCRYCQSRGGKLHAHHILSFAQEPDFRLDLVNGLTLCEECHK